jgi:hypothetical protein
LWTVAGTVAGTAAAIVAYQATAAAGPETKPASVTTPEPTPAAATTSWLPCERGWKVEGTTCVRVKEKVVVVHDLPAQAAAPAQTAGVRSSTHASTSGTEDDATENETEAAHVEHGDEGQTEQGDDASEDTEHASETDGDGPDHEDVGDDD